MAEDLSCDHCGVLITDKSTLALRDGKTFCCNNCANAYQRAHEAPSEAPTTAA